MSDRIKDGFPNQRMIVMPPDVTERCKSLAWVKNCYVTDLGHFLQARHHYVDRPDGCTEYVLIFCVGGNGWCQIDNQLWNVREGNVLIIPANTAHCYAAHEESPWSIYWAHINGIEVTDFMGYLGVSATQPLLETNEIMRMADYFENMLRDEKQDELHYSDETLLLLSTAQAHILALLLASKKISETLGKHIEQRVFRSIRYMRANLSQPLTLEQLGSNINMSSSHYSMLFKQQIHNSPIAFFNNLKMQRACELFNHGQTNISRVARDLGFEDAFYFSRIFKKIVGIPPSEYIKKLKSDGLIQDYIIG